MVTKLNANSRCPYTILTPTQKFEIGKRAAEVRSTAAMHYYAKNYPALELKEMSVRRFKNNYQTQLKTSAKEISDNSIVQKLVSKKHGCLLLVGEELHEELREYIRELRKYGVIINAHVFIAVGIRLVLNKDATLFTENGGHISLTKHWARYLFQGWAF